MSGFCVFPSCAWRARVCKTSIAEDHNVVNALLALVIPSRSNEARGPFSVEGLSEAKYFALKLHNFAKASIYSEGFTSEHHYLSHGLTFMQTIEAHVYHHGFAYRQGGDEYLILLPSLSKSLAIALLDELRCRLAELKYPDIEGSTTASIGVCTVEPDCPLTDRELRERANQAKKFAKDQGKNCIATYDGPRFVPQELRVVRPER